MIRMSDETYTACREYLEKLGAAEYKQHCAAKPKPKFAYRPSEYHSTLVRLLGKRDDVAFKSLKLQQGCASALGY